MSGGADGTVSTELAAARKRLQAAGIADPLLDARLLVADVTGFSLTDFVMKPDHPVTREESARIAAMVERRAGGEPVHRILGYREFHGLDLLLSTETLEPRPDTEVLVDTLLPALKKMLPTRAVRAFWIWVRARVRSVWRFSRNVRKQLASAAISPPMRWKPQRKTLPEMVSPRVLKPCVATGSKNLWQV